MLNMIKKVLLRDKPSYLDKNSPSHCPLTDYNMKLTLSSVKCHQHYMNNGRSP